MARGAPVVLEEVTVARDVASAPAAATAATAATAALAAATGATGATADQVAARAEDQARVVGEVALAGSEAMEETVEVVVVGLERYQEGTAVVQAPLVVMAARAVMGARGGPAVATGATAAAAAAGWNTHSQSGRA